MAGLSVDFIDAGVGDCSVIHLPDGGFIVVDVGPMNSPLVDWLADPNQMRRTCHAIVLTHNDADHSGSLPSILGLSRAGFGKLYMLQDRDKDDPKFSKLFRRALELKNQHRLDMQRLEVGTAPVWHDQTINAELKVVFPTFDQNVDAKGPNATSGILALLIKGQPKIVWSGDSHLRNIGYALGTNRPEWLAGMHHGAPKDWQDSSAQGALDGFMPKRSFISVGTHNLYGHPNALLIKKLAKNGCRVVCSQITRQCHTDAAKTGFSVTNGNVLHGYFPAKKGNPCRGTVRLTHNAGNFVVDRWDAEHLDKVKRLKRALCVS